MICNYPEYQALWQAYEAVKNERDALAKKLEVKVYCDYLRRQIDALKRDAELNARERELHNLHQQQWLCEVVTVKAERDELRAQLEACKESAANESALRGRMEQSLVAAIDARDAAERETKQAMAAIRELQIRLELERREVRDLRRMLVTEATP